MNINGKEPVPYYRVPETTEINILGLLSKYGYSTDQSRDYCIVGSLLLVTGLLQHPYKGLMQKNLYLI